MMATVKVDTVVKDQGRTTMAKTEKQVVESRRGFLKLAVTAAPAVAVTAVTGQEAAAEEAEPQGAGLRKTAHVKAYLESARF